MVWPDYSIHNYCRKCRLTFKKDVQFCKECKLKLRTRPAKTPEGKKRY